MTKETQGPLIEEIWEILTTDTELKEIMGGEVRVFNEWAEKNANFPYLVFRIDNNYNPTGLVAEGTLYLDIWDFAELSARSLKIRGRIISLIDKLKIRIGSDIAYCRFWLQADGQVPESTKGIIHRAMQFGLRYDRKIELENII